MSQPVQNQNKPQGQARIVTVSDFINRVTSAGRAAFDVFTGRPFSPGQPFTPSTSPREQHGGPRSYNYRTAQNMVYQPRHEFDDLTPFDELRNFVRLYPVASICVKKIVEGISRLEWSIKTKNKEKQSQYEKDGVIDQITAFFEKPSELDYFDTWIKKLLRDVLEIDAFCLYPQRARNGKLISLEVIDGATIKPIIDDRGRVLAYQQIVYGVPGSNYIRYGLDNLDEILPMPFPGLDGSELPQELIYLPVNARSDNPYGIAAVEMVIMAVNMALRKQSFDLSYFTDGNIPEMLLSPPEGMMNVDQVEEFETWFNDVLAGNDTARRRAKFLAWNAQPTILKPFVYDTALDQWMLKLTCAAYGVTPSEIGFTDDVNRATSEGQENVQFRGGIKPIAQWLAPILKQIIRLEFGYSDLEFVWEFNENEDALAQAQIDQIYILSKVLSPDEVRTMRFSGQVTGPAPVQPTPQLSQPQNQMQQPPPQQGDDQTQQGVSQEPNKLPQPDQGRQVPNQVTQTRKWVVNKAQGPVNAKETGVMIAFMLDPDSARILALNSEMAEKSEDLHVTLAYLGDIETIQSAKETIQFALMNFAMTNGPVKGLVNGYGVFNGDPASETRPLYANFDSPQLPQFREELIRILTSQGIEFTNNHGFTSHITLAYLPKDGGLPQIDIPGLELSFNQVWLCWGEERLAFDLVGGRQVKPASGKRKKVEVGK